MKARGFFFLLPGGVAAGLAAALVDAGVKSGILLLLAAVAAVALRKSAAATRHVVWTAGMACALAMPILSLSLPQWRVLPSWMGSEPAARDMASLATRLPPLPATSEIQVEHPSEAQGDTLTARSGSASDVHTSAPAPIAMQPIRARFSISTTVFFGWAVGAGLLLLALLRSAWSLHRLSRTSETVTEGVLAETVKGVAHELRLGRVVTIHVGSADAMPMVWGVWRAHLLLPSSAERWLPARLRAVMLHELAHVRRRDPVTLLMAQLARAIHWFNPLAWLAVHRLRVEQEHACDDYVLRGGVKPSDYASDVLEIATVLRASPVTASMAVSMANPARLESRLRVIVQEASNRTALAGWVVAVASAAAIGVALPLAMVRAADQKPEANTSKPTAFSPNNGYVFDREYEREMRSSDARYLDLDTGELVEAHPPGDLVWAMAESDLRVRAGMNMIAVPAQGEKWRSANANEVLDALRKATPQKQIRLGGHDETRQTWFFKTQEGAVGILQILPHDKGPGFVLVRSKLVRPRREFEHSAIILSSAGGNRFLNLGNGRTSASPPDKAPTAYLVDEPKIGWGLRVEDAYNYPTEPQRGMKLWESMTAEEAAEPAGLAAAPPELKGVYQLEQKNLPITILIPRYGLLQVAGIDRRTRSVVLEYKRVAMPETTTAQSEQRVSSKATDLLTLASAPATPPQPEQSIELGATRSVVDEWLGHVGAERLEQMWALTTRESSMDTGMRNLWEFKSIHAWQVVGNEQAAIVTTNRYTDNSGRARVLQFPLVNREGKWLIRECLESTPEDAIRRVEGFATYPGVKFDVRSEDLVGEWTVGFFIPSRHILRADGTGEVRELKGPNQDKPSNFRWEVQGDVFRRRFGEQRIEGRIVRLEQDLFAVRYADGTQSGFERYPRSK